jgi:hypothetical protein
MGIEAGVASTLMLIGAATMPTAFYLSPFKPKFRHLFFIPAGSVLLSIILFVLNVDEAGSFVMEKRKPASSSLHIPEDLRTSPSPMEQDAPSTSNERMV